MIGLTFLVLVFSCGRDLRADEASDRFASAKQSFDLKQFEQARAAFADFLAKYPNHAQTTEATFYLAESLLNLQQYDQASGYYNRLVSLGLTNPYARVALFRLGDIPYIQGQYDVAKPRLEEFVEKLPHDTNLQFVLYYLGDIAMRHNTPLEAEHYFGQSVRMFPQGARIVESQIGLAWAKNQLGNPTESNEIFRQLMNSSDPNVVEPATYQWGVAQFERADYQGAISTLTNFLTRWPRSVYYADAQRVLARCKGGLADYNGAIQIISQIAQPTIDDNLMKVRCLYGLGNITDAQTLLTGIERTAGPAYVDEIALLKAAFLYDQQNWKGTVAILEPVLLPQYNATTGKMLFNYSTMPAPIGGHKFSDESFLKACALLALAYAKNGETEKANATLTEMQGNAAMIGVAELQEIVRDTSTRLTDIYAQSGGPGGQWNPNWNYNGSSSGTTPGGGSGSHQPGSLPSTAQKTDIERFWEASQLYDRKNWYAATQLLDQLLQTQYNLWTKQFHINYQVTGRNGTLDETTLSRACSLLILARGQLGDFDQAGAALTAFSQRMRPNDSAQQELLRQTQNQLNELARNGTLPGGSGGGTGLPISPGNTGSLLSETEQRRVLRECNSLYNAKRFDQVDAKLNELLNKRPVDAVHAEAALLRGKTLFELGKEREAILLLETVVKDYSSSTQYADALWLLGLYYESCGDSFRAVEYFQLLADQFPNYKNIDGALYFLARDDLENGNGRKAGTYLTRIYRNYQNGKYWSHAAWTLAYEAYKKKEYVQSELYIQKILHHPPDYAILDRVLFLRGDIAMKKKEYDTALVAFREVGKLCPESPLRDDADKNMQLAAREAAVR